MTRLSLTEDLYPVEAFFNRLSHDRFKAALANFTQERGYNPEDMTCFFPRDLAEESGQSEAEIQHIEFWTYAGDQELTVTLADMKGYLKQAIEVEKKAQSDPEFDALADKALATLDRMAAARTV